MALNRSSLVGVDPRAGAGRGRRAATFCVATTGATAATRPERPALHPGIRHGPRGAYRASYTQTRARSHTRDDDGGGARDSGADDGHGGLYQHETAGRPRHPPIRGGSIGADRALQVGPHTQARTRRRRTGGFGASPAVACAASQGAVGVNTAPARTTAGWHHRGARKRRHASFKWAHTRHASFKWAHTRRRARDDDDPAGSGRARRWRVRGEPGRCRRQHSTDAHHGGMASPRRA